MDKIEEYDKKFTEFLRGITFHEVHSSRRNTKNSIKLFKTIMSKFLDIYVHDLDDFLSAPAMFIVAMEYHIDDINVSEHTKFCLMNCVDLFNQTFCNMITLPQINEYPLVTQLLTEFFSKNTKILDVGAGQYPVSTVFLGTKFNPTVVGMENDECFFSNETLSRFNAEVKLETFLPYTNVDNFDLLTGFAPCDATKSLVLNAKTHNKPYFIRLCECQDINEWKDLLLPIDNKITFFNDFAFNMDVNPIQMSRELDKQIYQKLNHLNSHGSSSMPNPLYNDSFGDLNELDFSYTDIDDMLDKTDIDDIMGLFEIIAQRIVGKIKD